jgi:Mn-dependent DtxR family transcriptional regulator
MKLNTKKKLSRLEFYEFFLYLHNHSIGFTNNEMKLLAFLMEIYPERLTTYNRRILESKMKVQPAYMSQLLTSLKKKGVLEKKKSIYYISNEQIKVVAIAFAKHDNFEILFDVQLS